MEFLEQHRRECINKPINILLSNLYSEYEQSIEKIAEEFVASRSEYVIQKLKSRSVLSDSQAKDKLIVEIKDSLKLDGLFEHLSKALQTINQEGRVLLKEEKWDALRSNLTAAFALLKNKKELEKDDEANLGLMQQLKITTDSMLAMDEIGTAMHNSENFSEALAIRYLIVVFDPIVALNWTKLGIAHQKMENYRQALKCFCSSMLYDPTDISTRLLAAECYLHLNQIDDAQLEFQAAQELNEQEEDGEQWSEYLQNLKGAIVEKR